MAGIDAHPWLSPGLISGGDVGGWGQRSHCNSLDTACPSAVDEAQSHSLEIPGGESTSRDGLFDVFSKAVAKVVKTYFKAPNVLSRPVSVGLEKGTFDFHMSQVILRDKSPCVGLLPAAKTHFLWLWGTRLFYPPS